MATLKFAGGPQLERALRELALRSLAGLARNSGRD